MITTKKKNKNTSRDNASLRKKKFERAFGNYLYYFALLIPVLGAGYGTCSIIEKCNQEKRDAALVDKTQQNKNKPKDNAGQSKNDPKIQDIEQDKH